MAKLNKFEIAAALSTEKRREIYLLEILGSKLNNKKLMNAIDTIKLAEECHPQELLLSKQWQQGYECCRSRTQKKLCELLESLLMTASTSLSAAAILDFGDYIIDELEDQSLLSRNR